jgi:hypothetical protein
MQQREEKGSKQGGGGELEEVQQAGRQAGARF